jgi:hypothetical protein
VTKHKHARVLQLLYHGASQHHPGSAAVQQALTARALTARGTTGKMDFCRALPLAAHSPLPRTPPCRALPLAAHSPLPNNNSRIY